MCMSYRSAVLSVCLWTIAASSAAASAQSAESAALIPATIRQPLRDGYATLSGDLPAGAATSLVAVRLFK